MVWLSQYQQDFLAVMNSVGCLSTEQAYLVLDKFLNTREQAAKKLLDSLITGRYISLSEDGKFIMNGSKQLNKSVSLNRDVIKIMNYILDATDSLDVLKSIFRGNGGQSILNFINNGNMYEVIPMTTAEMYKATLAENKFKEMQRTLSNRNVNIKAFTSITIFMFENSEKEKIILEQMEIMNLELPHIILIFKDSDISVKMNYALFESI